MLGLRSLFGKHQTGNVEPWLVSYIQGVLRKPFPFFGVLGYYLEGQGDLVSRLQRGIIRVTIVVIGVINLLTSSP